jgi:hypothetical protein
MKQYNHFCKVPIEGQGPWGYENRKNNKKICILANYRQQQVNYIMFLLAIRMTWEILNRCMAYTIQQGMKCRWLKNPLNMFQQGTIHPLLLGQRQRISLPVAK